MIAKKLKILCIDPGYSLAEANHLYLDHNYPGHLLYGTNHLTDQGFEVVFQPKRNAGRINSEFHTIIDYLKIKPDCIYIPFSDFGGGIINFKESSFYKVTGYHAFPRIS